MSAEVIVVGGGVVGATTAWALAREGVDVLLLESGGWGQESTGKSAAIVRCHYSNAEVVRMAVHSRNMLARLPLYLECDPVFHRTGWLFLVDEADAQLAVDNAEMQDEEGLDTVEVEDLQEVLPGVVEDGVAYALLEADSGFADPIATTEAYVQAFRRLGGDAREGVRVESIEVDRGKVTGVRVGGESRAAGTVVLAAGPWSLALGRTAGVELPLEITREQDVVFATAPVATAPLAVSAQIDRVYLRPAPEYGEDHLLVGRGFPKQYENVDPDSYDHDVDDAFEADVRERVGRRLPQFDGMRRVAARVGMYDVAPDWHPILGPIDEVEGLVLATGGSGHCFKLAPAIGELVAGSITEQKVEYADWKTFSVNRFAEGRELKSTYGGNRA